MFTDWETVLIVSRGSRHAFGVLTLMALMHRAALERDTGILVCDDPVRKLARASKGHARGMEAATRDD